MFNKVRWILLGIYLLSIAACLVETGVISYYLLIDKVLAPSKFWDEPRVVITMLLVSVIMGCLFAGLFVGLLRFKRLFVWLAAFSLIPWFGLMVYFDLIPKFHDWRMFFWQTLLFVAGLWIVPIAHSIWSIVNRAKFIN